MPVIVGSRSGSSFLVRFTGRVTNTGTVVLPSLDLLFGIVYAEIFTLINSPSTQEAHFGPLAPGQGVDVVMQAYVIDWGHPHKGLFTAIVVGFTEGRYLGEFQSAVLGWIT